MTKKAKDVTMHEYVCINGDCGMVTNISNSFIDKSGKLYRDDTRFSFEIWDGIKDRNRPFPTLNTDDDVEIADASVMR